MKKFLIVTPVINANELLIDTVKSVISQIGLGHSFSILYVICDGGSADIDILFSELPDLNCIEGLDFVHLRHDDESMYDSIAIGLKKIKCDFDYFSYINSGDYYSSYALKSLVNEFETSRSEWVCGAVGSYNEQGYLFKLIEPVAFPNKVIRSGFFNGRLLPYIQQESNFITRRALRFIDLDALSKFRLAGDAYIWKVLSDNGLSPTILPLWLAGFRRHNGQQSTVFNVEYKREFESIYKNNLRLFILLNVKFHILVVFNLLHPSLRPKKIVNWLRRW